MVLRLLMQLQRAPRHWSECEDEANGADCVTLDVKLPAGITARDLQVNLRLRGLQVSAQGTRLLEERFAEEGWLSLDDSYWELADSDAFAAASGTRTSRALRCFLVKNPNFQREPLYCLFESELLPTAESEEADGDEETGAGAAGVSATEACASGAPAPEAATPKVLDVAQCQEATLEGVNTASPVSMQPSIAAEQAQALAQPLVPDSAKSLVLQALAVAGRVPPDDRALAVLLLAPPSGVEEVAAELVALQQAASQEVHVTVAGFGPPHESFVPNAAGGSAKDFRVRQLDARQSESITVCTNDRLDVAYVPAGLLERWYYAWTPVVLAIAGQGGLVVVPGSPAASSGFARASTEAILKSFGCQVLDTGGHDFSCVSGGRGGTLACLHRTYQPLRQLFATLGLDFRPAFPVPVGGREAGHADAQTSSVADAARLACLATGGKSEDAATAAAVAAAEAAAAALAVGSNAVAGAPPGSPPIAPRVVATAALRAARAAGGSEARAVAVAALLGLREGLFSWTPGQPLERHAAEVAGAVCEALALEGAWERLPADDRERRLKCLVRTGGLGRPGEIALALCQALLGVGRPRGGSRLLAALSALRRSARALLAAASLPNLLEESGAEADAFSATVLGGLDMVRLSSLLRDEEEAC